MTSFRQPQTVFGSKDAKREQGLFFSPQTDLGWQHPSIGSLSMYHFRKEVSSEQETKFIILCVMLSGGLISGYIHIPDGIKSTKEN